MGHFVINLPENKRADVNFGKVVKKSFFLYGKKGEEKRGYVVKIAGENSKILLFKSTNGQWSKDEDGNVFLDENILFSIKEAIIEKEKELNNN